MNPPEHSLSPPPVGVFRLYRGARDGAASALFVTAENPSSPQLKRLEREYSLRAELDTAWAARPVALSRQATRITLTLEDPGGEPLDRILDGPLPPAVFLPIAASLANAIRQVHERGLIHKDLNPANMLVDMARGRAWLTGFGLASRRLREQRDPDAPEVIAGTLPYMAPEQTGRMNRSVDARSDLYSLGITFYQMLTGVLPFTAVDPLGWIHCHMARQPIPPHELITTIPAQLAAIVMKLLAKTAEERYQTAGGLETDLKRCLEQWRAEDRIDLFPLGALDASDRLVIPEKLYGRSHEIGLLLKAFDRVVQDGATRFVLVSGYAGTGKSAVVNELHKALVPSRGLFASGKFDQYKRDIPYATLGQAFGSLVRGLLARGQAELDGWREALREALGPNGQLVVGLVPELELVIGPQPPVPELSAQDAQHRFQAVLEAFLGVLARAEHPLALFLDDLQWIDAATLELLEDLATRSEVRHLLLTGAYRDNEVDSAHPLTRTLEIVRRGGAPLEEIVLTPLSIHDTGELLTDCLRCDAGRAMSLAHLVHEKTEGNPFFAIQFIASLAEEGLLAFDHRDARWAWDPERIRAKGYSDNVADLMIAKVNRLPAETRSALQQLACLGNGVDFDQLDILCEGRPDEIHDALREAVRNGLVLPSERAYRFLHDRVQEAAYSSIPADQRAAAHLRIGRLLAARTAPDQIEENVFEIVSQLNRGAHLIDDREQRAQVAELNLVAGKRAKAAIAHASALGYFASGLAMLGEDAWLHRYRLVFDLELNRAHCELLTGDFAVAEQRLAKLALHASGLADLAAVILIQVHLFTPQEKYGRAVDICLAYLRRLGVHWSPHPTEDEVRREYERLRQHIGTRPIESFIDLPRMVDPESRRLMDVLGALSLPANLFDNRLMFLLVLRITNLSLERGITDESCIGFLFLSLVLGPRFGDFHAGYRFGQLSLDLVDKRGLERFKTRVYCSYGSLVSPWIRHVRDSYAYARRAIESSPHTGDVTWMGFAARGRVTYRLSCGDPLQEVEAEAERTRAFIRTIKTTYIFNLVSLQLRWIRVLRGLTAGFGTFNDHDFDEAGFERGFMGATLPRYDSARYWSYKAQLRFLADEYADALAAVAKAEAMPESAVPTIEYAQFVYFAALAHAASFDTATPEDRPRHSSAVATYHRRYAAWAEDCPENFRTGAALIGAEIARMERRPLDAEQLYEDAIRCAREHGFVQYEAISYEVAARFYAERGLQTICNSCLHNARACYLRWGAEGKVRHLDLKYPQLQSASERTAAERTIGAPVEQLDLATVVKVSQAVSGEIQFDRLIETLMRTALEHAGAARGLLLRPLGDAMWIEAEAVTAAATVEVRRPKKRRVNAAALPESVLHYVTRTGTSVMLSDASEQPPYSTDEYVRRNFSRSILCLPLIKQARLIGVLYLENGLASHVFTPARIATLRLLASQAAMSLENARLYRELQDADAFLAHAQQLSHTGSWSWNLADGEITWSDEMYRIFELDRSADLTLSSTLRHTHPDDVERVRHVTDAVVRSGKDFELENRLKMPNGSVKHLRVVARAITGDAGDTRYIGTVMDVTAFKEAQERLRKAQAQLADIGRQTEMGELASLIAHEVTQPLAAIVTNADSCLLWLKKEQPNVDKALKAAERLVQNGRRAADVVRSIRAQARKSPEDVARLDINQLIAATLELMRPELQRRGIRLETRLLDHLKPIKGDATRLQQVIVNLMTNAVEAMEAFESSSRIVRVTTERDDGGAIVTAVEDSGAGIDAAILGRIFEPMFTTKPQGMGLGLSICRSIVESHGGRLWASQNPAGGCIFRFSIPEASSAGVLQ